MNDLKELVVLITAGIDGAISEGEAESALLALVAEVVQLRARVAELEVELEQA